MKSTCSARWAGILYSSQATCGCLVSECWYTLYFVLSRLSASSTDALNWRNPRLWPCSDRSWFRENVAARLGLRDVEIDIWYIDRRCIASAQAKFSSRSFLPVSPRLLSTERIAECLVLINVADCEGDLSAGWLVRLVGEPITQSHCG